jgi:hypothetical protein
MVQVPDKLKPQTDRNVKSDADPADQVYIHLSDHDRDTVLETMDADVPPNDALKSLARRFRERYG